MAKYANGIITWWENNEALSSRNKMSVLNVVRNLDCVKKYVFGPRIS